MEKHAYGQLKPEKLPKNISDIKSRQHVLRSMIEHFDNLCIYHQTWLDAFFQHKFSVYPMKNKIMQKKKCHERNYPVSCKSMFCFLQEKYFESLRERKWNNNVYKYRRSNPKKVFVRSPDQWRHLLKTPLHKYIVSTTMAFVS